MLYDDYCMKMLHSVRALKTILIKIKNFEHSMEKFILNLNHNLSVHNKHVN